MVPGDQLGLRLRKIEREPVFVSAKAETRKMMKPRGWMKMFHWGMKARIGIGAAARR